MSDDASYSSFLDKANQDTGAAPLNSGPKSAQAPKQANTKNIPASLHKIDATYTSDTDEPFEPVAFAYEQTSLPDAKAFETLVAKGNGNNGPARAEELSVHDFDPRGQYTDVVERVKDVVDQGEVRVFRVARGKTRAEYYIVGLESGKDGRLLGVMAKAVES